MPIAAIIGLVIQLAPIVAQAIPQVAQSMKDLVDQLIGNAPAPDQAELQARWDVARAQVQSAHDNWVSSKTP